MRQKQGFLPLGSWGAGLGLSSDVRARSWGDAPWVGPGALGGAGMAKALTPTRAPGGPGPEPGLVKQPPQKKKGKKRFWKHKAREANDTPGSSPAVAAMRPPKAPEDFSRNWRALQQVRRRPRSWKAERGLGAPKARSWGWAPDVRSLA